MIWLISFVLFFLAVSLGLGGRRVLDGLAERQTWSLLTELGRTAEGGYDQDIVSSLPEPARRYFNYMIEPGTKLHTAVKIKMIGELGLGTKENPNYRTMRARQILSPPYGFVWKVKAGVIIGSDSATPATSWTRFWLMGILPIVRASGLDHRRAAFGRVIAEAVAWSPASLLPAKHVQWDPVNGNSARATVRWGDLTQAVDIRVDEAGRPITAVIQRWTNANSEKIFRRQPFGAYLSEFKLFGGYRLATRVEVGNHFGTDDYFPFFKAKVTKIQFPKTPNS